MTTTPQQRLEPLLASPIPEVADAARKHAEALTEYLAASQQRASYARALTSADDDDAYALEAALSAGRPAPAPIDRNVLEVQRAEAARREAAYSSIVDRLYYAAVGTARSHAQAWIGVLDVEHGEARADLAAALTAVREAASRLDSIDTQSLTAVHLLTANETRSKFVTIGVGSTRTGVWTLNGFETGFEPVLAGVAAYQETSPGEKVTQRQEELHGQPSSESQTPATRAFVGGSPLPDEWAHYGVSFGSVA